MYGAVALGGALGSVGRAWLGGVVGGALGGTFLGAFPWGTWVVNIIGSFVIGWFAAVTDVGARWEAHAPWRVLVMVGVGGGFTTFSALSLQVLELLRGGALARAGIYIVGSVLVGLLAVWAGAVLGRGGAGI